VCFIAALPASIQLYSSAIPDAGCQHSRRVPAADRRQGVLRARLCTALVVCDSGAAAACGTQTVLERYSLSDIYRWGFTPAVSFYFEMKAPGGGAGGPRHTFNTVQVRVLSLSRAVVFMSVCVRVCVCPSRCAPTLPPHTILLLSVSVCLNAL
jgi:hypothetical protein